ncbi:helix-turn-helix domain-containing protein [Kribbella sp. NPDC051620]|uniref:helix-turn-helix domain-containing protein n=1 Tax=Kribbella sp. NPDC051620 TaxID=3364120 RepID=UPI0037AFB307
MSPTLYTTDEVAELLRISVFAVYKHVAAGTVSPLRTPGPLPSELRFTSDDVVRMLLAMRPTVAAPVRRHLALVSG